MTSEETTCKSDTCNTTEKYSDIIKESNLFQKTQHIILLHTKMNYRYSESDIDSQIDVNNDDLCWKTHTTTRSGRMNI